MTVTTGLPDPKHNFSFPQVTLTAEERTVKGSYVGSCVPTRDIPRFIELYKQGRLPVDTLLTDALALENINEGFDRLEKGDVARLCNRQVVLDTFRSLILNTFCLKQCFSMFNSMTFSVQMKDFRAMEQTI